MSSSSPSPSQEDQSSSSPPPLSSSSSPSSSPSPSSPPSDSLIQYIILRNDLKSKFKYSTGSLVSNGSHAATMAIFSHFNLPETQRFLGEGFDQHVVTLGAVDEEELKTHESLFISHRIPHSVWIERPENLMTAIATAPQLTSLIKPLVKNLKLFK